MRGHLPLAHPKVVAPAPRFDNLRLCIPAQVGSFCQTGLTVKTLLIDNYDSFTYNLMQYIAQADGEPPSVVRNDEVSWEEVEAGGFEAIVVSPGPGRPQNPRDLGLSAEAVRRARVPLLGVCLGHQAIGHLAGARVGLAREPRHGRLSRVTHDGSGLFAGIPSPFSVVRYHSLMVTELPPELLATAWAEDGTLMGLRHRDRPVWGVQFHPESICTEHGERLIANFLHLAAGSGASAAPRPSRPAPAASGAGSRARPAERAATERVLARRIGPTVDPEALFVRLYGESPTAFWLDSSSCAEGRARFSYMGDASGPRSEILRYRSSTRSLHVRRGTGVVELRESVLSYLDRALRDRAVEAPDLPFDFVGGYVGYFGYEMKGELDGEEAAAAATPDAAWILADRFVAFDHAERAVWLVCLGDDESGREWLATVERALLEAGGPVPTPSPDGARLLTGLRWRHDLDRYREMILTAQEEIRQGETYEVCLTNELTARGAIDDLSVYRTLRRRNPAPYAAFLRFDGDLSILSASPELFLGIDRSGTVESKPIKGTAPRGATAQEDVEVAAALAAGEKNRSENLMIVDLLRNDLNRVCEVGSVHVPAIFQVESYATVHQLVSTIRGRLPPDRTAIDCVRATFPGGSMTGAPKVRTMRIIDGLEQGPRGVYSGSLGYLSLNGAARLNIVIRTIVATPDGASMGAGGAIIALSDPDEEVAEIALKASAQVRVLGECGAGFGEPARALLPIRFLTAAE